MADVVGAQRWHSNRRVVRPPGAVEIPVPRRRRRRRDALARVRALPSGAPLVLVTAAPGARRRCRRFAARGGIVREQEYLAFPTAAVPGCLVEDEPAVIGVFARSVLGVPPRVPFATAIGVALGVARSTHGWRLIRALAPGRVVVGRRA